jgi:hypothetical protein
MEFAAIQDAFPQLTGGRPRVPRPRRNNGRYLGNVDAPGCVAVESTVGGMAQALIAGGAQPAGALQFAITGARPGNNSISPMPYQTDPTLQAIFIPAQPKQPFNPAPMNLV